MPELNVPGVGDIPMVSDGTSLVGLAIHRGIVRISSSRYILVISARSGDTAAIDAIRNERDIIRDVRDP